MTKKKNPFLFFDIETGDLSAKESSVLSISYLSPGRRPKTLFNQPAPGSTVSKWASENVWKPLVERFGTAPRKTEEQTLSTFLKVLEGHRGGTIAGWNIGYVPIPQGEGVKGFDIPFLLSRAGKYPGMAEKYQQALSSLSIRDIGREHSVRIAQEVSKYPELVDKDLFAQAQSFTKLININKATQRLNTVPEIAQWMGTPGQYGGFELAGWKLKSVHKYLFGSEFANQHFSEADVSATARIFSEGNLSLLQGPSFVSAWNKEALLNKALASKSRGMEEKITGRAAALVGERVTNWGKTAIRIAGEHKGLVGFGALALGLWATKPLSWFSGKDDEYNTIEGLSHKGIAKDKRRVLTDFGSGWTRKIVNSIFKSEKTIMVGGMEAAIRSASAGKGNFSIAATELGLLGNEQLRHRLGMFAPDVAISAKELGSLSSTQIRGKLGLGSTEKIVEEAFEVPFAPKNAAAEVFGVPGTGFGPGEAFATKNTIGTLEHASSDKIDRILQPSQFLKKMENVGEFKSASMSVGEKTGVGRPKAKLKDLGDKTGVGRPKAMKATESQIADFREKWYKLHGKAVRQASSIGSRAGKRHRFKAGRIVQ